MLNLTRVITRVTKYTSSRCVPSQGVTAPCTTAATSKLRINGNSLARGVVEYPFPKTEAFNCH